MGNASRLALAANLLVIAAPPLAQTKSHPLVMLIRVGDVPDDLPNPAAGRFEGIVGRIK